ncbi:hypothetical protein [Butyrivibrio sp. XPD2002]|uniref:hypothetical protein n=1 Tax=Butyrivibrio sp. XPD2002 TaxID=1280665 RepID=UPI0003FCBDD9|nr:hypothetical protein [Butyrivibrio sp. XPD2002]
MARIETLTAYKCRFSYLQRNNPLIEEQREAIRKGEEPNYSFSDFIETYKEYTSNLAIGENSDRAIALTENKVEFRERNEVKIWHIMPNAGKQGKPITVMKKTGEKHNYGSDAAALYEYHVFVYENDNGFIAIFHRQNGSGCKSVFLETANNAIKGKGLKLEMELIVPMVDEINDVTPTKIIMQFSKQELSSDVADNVNGTKKKHIIREVVLNLEEQENSKILDILRKLHAKEIDQANAFTLIKTELNDDVDYNDAEIKVRIGGKRHQKIRWCEFESIVGAHDISARLYEAYKSSHDFAGELAKLSDEYYDDILESEEV